MQTLRFVKIAETSEIPPGRMKINAEKEILIANVMGNYYAIGSICSHAGGDLSKGSLKGNIVTCPRHGSKFDVTTGKVISGPKILFLHRKIKNLPTYELRVEGNDILRREE